jgi:hypothetical protein
MDTLGPSYEIRTYKHQRHASLTMIATCPNDIVAIVMARNFARKGEGLEVWRDDLIVYRFEPDKTKSIVRPKRRKRSVFSVRQLLHSLKASLPLPNNRWTFPAGQLTWFWFKLLGGKA